MAKDARQPDEEDLNPYGVVRESEEELRLIEKNKPRFGDVRDKFKKSARGPASALLVTPVNLLIGEGALTGLFGLGIFIAGMWNWVFTDAPPSDEQISGFIEWMFYGLVAMFWAGVIVFGASKMQSLDHYGWALVGATFGMLPLLAGVFALVALRDPRVIAGFEEVEGALDEDEDEDGEKGDDEDEDDEPAPRKKR